MPPAAPTSTSASHDVATTCRAACAAPKPARESGTEVTIPSEPAVTVTSDEDARYAYTKLVAAPGPSRAANGRQTT